jgi:hypothetical protein
MPCSRPRAGQRQCRCVSGRVPDRAQVGRSGSPCANSIHTPALPAGLTRCQTGGTAAPTRWPPRPSAQAFGRMSARALPLVCARGRYHTRPAARRGVAGHYQSDWPRRRASRKGRGSPQPPGGTVHWRCGPQATRTRFRWPDGQLSPKAVLTITVGHPVPVTHRPPPWCSRRCPAAGHGAPANPCPDRPPL